MMLFVGRLVVVGGGNRSEDLKYGRTRNFCAQLCSHLQNQQYFHLGNQQKPAHYMYFIFFMKARSTGCGIFIIIVMHILVAHKNITHL